MPPVPDLITGLHANLRQLCLATRLYVDDNRQHLPLPNWNPPWVAGWLY